MSTHRDNLNKINQSLMMLYNAKRFVDNNEVSKEALELIDPFHELNIDRSSFSNDELSLELDNTICNLKELHNNSTEGLWNDFLNLFRSEKNKVIQYKYDIKHLYEKYQQISDFDEEKFNNYDLKDPRFKRSIDKSIFKSYRYSVMRKDVFDETCDYFYKIYDTVSDDLIIDSIIRLYGLIKGGDRRFGKETITAIIKLGKLYRKLANDPKVKELFAIEFIVENNFFKGTKSYNYNKDANRVSTIHQTGFTISDIDNYVRKMIDILNYFDEKYKTFNSDIIYKIYFNDDNVDEMYSDASYMNAIFEFDLFMSLVSEYSQCYYGKSIWEVIENLRDDICNLLLVAIDCKR